MVRIVVVDTSTQLPALLRPGGARRQLLTVLAYGGITAYHRVIGGAEQDAMSALVKEFGAGAVGDSAVVGGLPIKELIERAETARTRLEEHLPALTPDDFVMAGSPLLFNEIEQKIMAKGHIWGATVASARTYRRALLAVTPYIVPPFEANEVRDYGIADPEDNFVVHTAISANAEFLISDDKKLAPDGGSVVIDCPTTGKSVTAIQFQEFVDDHLNTSNFDLRTVSKDILPLALREAAELRRLV